MWGGVITCSFFSAKNHSTLTLQRASVCLQCSSTVLSFALALTVSCTSKHKFRGSNTGGWGDNRAIKGKKKGVLRWYKVVGGCDDLEQVPGGSKMEIMLP
jgi:hypothetical protein